MVSAGVNHTLMLTDKGALYCSGYGFCGSAGQQPEGMGGGKSPSQSAFACDF